jgi:hypothetical protein
LHGGDTESGRTAESLAVGSPSGGLGRGVWGVELDKLKTIQQRVKNKQQFIPILSKNKNNLSLNLFFGVLWTHTHNKIIELNVVVDGKSRGLNSNHAHTYTKISSRGDETI